MQLTRSLVAGIMNKDLDERLVPNGQYRDAQNVTIGTSEEAGIGAVANELGNSQVSGLQTAARAFSGDNTFSLTGAKTIGSISAPAEFLIFWFVKASTGNIIASYNAQTGLTSVLAMDTRAGSNNVLNFKVDYLITGVNYISGLLFWTDNLNPPRRIDTKAFYAYNNFTEESINVIVKPPLAAPTLSFRIDSNASNNIKDKFLYFAYRYKYMNNEYSSFSPFSVVGFEPDTFTFDYGTGVNKSMQNKYNLVDISFSIGGSNIKEIQLLFKDSASTNVNVIENILKADLPFNVQGVTVNGTTATFSGFSNNKVYGVLPSNQLTRLFDNVPLKAKAQELIGSRIIYGNYTQFYNIVDLSGKKITPNYSVSVVSESKTSPDYVVNNPVKTLHSDRNYELGICYMDDYGRMSTVLTSTTNTASISSLNSDTANYLRLNIISEAPAFATKYRVFVKQAKGQYYTIFPNIFYTDGIYTYFMINESDVDKVHANDYIVFKVNPEGITYKNDEFKVLDVSVKPKDFLGNSKTQITGVYMKVKTSGNTAFSQANLIVNKTTSKGVTSARNSQYTLGFTCSSSEPGIEPILNPHSFTEDPIFYGSVSNDLAVIGKLTKVEVDRRIKIEIDGRTTAGIDTFKVSVLSTDVAGVSLIQNVPITGANQPILNGTKVLCTIRFASTKGHKIGDSWRINQRATWGFNDGRTVFGGPLGFLGFSLRKGQNDPFGGITVFPKDATSILGGAVITIKINETKVAGGESQPEQTFISSRDYANIEEWFFEDAIYERFSMTARNQNQGAITVFFRRCGNYNNIQSGGQSLTQVDQTDNGDVRMFIRGHADANSDEFKNGNYPACLRAILTVDCTITQTKNKTIIETQPKNTDVGIYHETETLSVTNGLHAGTNGQDQTRAVAGTTKKAAVVDLKNLYNAYCFRNGVESDRIRDDFNGSYMQYSPRVSSTIENYEQEHVPHGLTYSGVFRQDTGTNRLNEFNLSTANFKYVDRFFGSIQKLYARDTNLIVFQENKISTVLYGKNLLSDSTGGGSIASVPEVLGTQISFVGEYGISLNPESFATWGNDMFFTDARRGVVLTISGNDLGEISIQGMKDFFRDLFIAGTNKQKIGVLDPYSQMYVLTSNDSTSVPCQLSVSPISVTVDNTAQTSNIFDISSNSGWVITGIPVWMTVSPSSGTGDQDVTASFTLNSTLASRTATLTITASCGNVVTVAITQTGKQLVRRAGVTIGGSGDAGTVSTQKYNYSSSGTSGYEFVDSSFTTAPVGIFNTLGAPSGTNGVPYPGDTVTLYAYNTTTSPSGSPANPFLPGLGNKAYYLVSNTQYTNADYLAMIALATPVTMTLAGTEYSGNFTYLTPSNEQYLYLLWDYRNIVSCGSTASYSGTALTSGTTVTMGSANGNVTFNYDAQSTPDRFVITLNGSVVSDSGYVGLNTLANYNALIAAGVSASDIKLVSPYDGLVNNSTGTLKFTKTQAGDPTLTVYSPLSSNGWSVATACAGLNTVTIDTTNGTLANVCSQTPATVKYHNGQSATPTVGVIVYNESTGATVYNGGNAYHKFGTSYAFITSSGIITEIGSCVCVETFSPIVTMSNVNINVGSNTSIKVSATNNPTSYNLVTTCKTFTFFGGTDGAVFYGANCETGYYETFPVSSYEKSTKCYTDGTVTKLSGSADATLDATGSCGDISLPAGITFDSTNGFLTGIAIGQGQYKATFNATNCFGTGPNTTINISAVELDAPATAFQINASSQANAAAACALTPAVWVTLYHNGYYTYPILGDTVYIQSRGGNTFNGNNLWYVINNNQSIQISTDGVVTSVFNCGSTPPTPPTPPAGNYYTAVLCNSTYSAVLYDAVSRVISSGTKLKTTDGNCWTVGAAIAPISTSFNVPTTIVTYASCAACTGVTPTLTEVFLTDSGSKASVCASTAYYSYWTDGTVGSSGTLYMNSSGTIVASAGYYKNQAAPSNAYYWNGTAWTLTEAC
jgi:hypothetical protein